VQIINKREEKPRGQSSMVNPERLVTLGTQDIERKQQQETKEKNTYTKLKR
jgi:hypothetical protein